MYNTRAGYKDTLNDYMGLVNQPTAADAIAEGFSNAARSPAEGPQQRMSNALLSGIGAGVKAAANRSRQEKLLPELEKAGKALSISAELETKVQQEQLRNYNISQFFTQNAGAIMQLSRASLAGDTNATDTLAKAIYQNYRSLLNDGSLGAFDHYDKGAIYFENLETGKIEGRNIANLIYQAGIDPAQIFGHDALGVISAFSPGAKTIYENTKKEQELKMQSMQAQNALTQAHTGVYNSQADVYKTQAEQNRYALDNPENAMQKKILEERIKANTDLVPKIFEQYGKNNEVIDSAKELKDMISSSSLAGGSTTAKILRFVAEATGHDESVVNAKNAGQFYIEWMNQNTKGALSDKDVELYKSTFASIDKNPKASEAILNRLIAKLEKQNSIFDKQLEMYESDPKSNIHSLDLYKGFKDRGNKKQNLNNPDSSIVDFSTIPGARPVQ